MISNLQRSFKKIGADLKIVGARPRQLTSILLDVIETDGDELFEIAIRDEPRVDMEISVLEVLPKERHLVLLARAMNNDGDLISKEHFLCGHDERHLFVAAVDGVSTVAAAKDSLKPNHIRARETGLSALKRNRRHTELFVRQGEWFFEPVFDLAPPPIRVRRNEPLVRGTGSKAHIAQFAYRQGGEAVRVCRQYPNGLTEAEYRALIVREPRAKNFNWRHMVRDMDVFVTGTVRHPDHATVVLHGWHRVFLNQERRFASLAFLD